MRFATNIKPLLQQIRLLTGLNVGGKTLNVAQNVHDRDYNIQAECLNASHIHYTYHFLRRCQVQVLDTFGTQLMNFIRKYFLLFILDF